MKTLTIEYAYGFSEPAGTPAEVARKVIDACCHSDPSKPLRGGFTESTRNGGCFSVTYYERDFAGEKRFVARVSGSKSDIQKVIKLTPDYSFQPVD